MKEIPRQRLLTILHRGGTATANPDLLAKHQLVGSDLTAFLRLLVSHSISQAMSTLGLKSAADLESLFHHDRSTKTRLCKGGWERIGASKTKAIGKNFAQYTSPIRTGSFVHEGVQFMQKKPVNRGHILQYTSPIRTEAFVHEGVQVRTAPSSACAAIHQGLISKVAPTMLEIFWLSLSYPLTANSKMQCRRRDENTRKIGDFYLYDTFPNRTGNFGRLGSSLRWLVKKKGGAGYQRRTTQPDSNERFSIDQGIGVKTLRVYLWSAASLQSTVSETKKKAEKNFGTR
ncbi:hypothetical protein FB45DRAFT_1004764 [Roridomyces roridus]|uniref:Uncharacterized protein n=1 Tax=Roridomyces roridus TaxID=1738132 RepID=A0AAD7BQA4_9AGAR|nr:hypothetical protein FB45DRAFT_1004764 [Roridomyces roridus]